MIPVYFKEALNHHVVLKCQVGLLGNWVESKKGCTKSINVFVIHLCKASLPIFLTGTLKKPNAKITEVQKSHQKSIREMGFGKSELEQMKKLDRHSQKY